VCKEVSYCDRRCQKADWSMGGHKEACHELDPDEKLQQRFHLIMFNIGRAVGTVENCRQAQRAQVRMKADAGLMAYASGFASGEGAWSTDPETTKALRIIKLLVMDAENWKPVPHHASRADVQARKDAMEEYRVKFGKQPVRRSAECLPGEIRPSARAAGERDTV